MKGHIITLDNGLIVVPRTQSGHLWSCIGVGHLHLNVVTATDASITRDIALIVLTIEASVEHIRCLTAERHDALALTVLAGHSSSIFS